MKFRYLRFAFSATCLIACVLLIVLWVRSYWRTTYIVAWFGQLSLQPGAVEIFIADPTDKGGVPAGTVIHVSSKEWMEDFQKQIQAYGTTIRGNHWSRVWGAFYFQNNYILPYWFIAIIFALLGGAPWLRRFSLRTLLIATTLVAVVLGAIVYALRG